MSAACATEGRVGLKLAPPAPPTDAADELETELWTMVFDERYQEASGAPGRNWIGWNSVYTGRPIPVREMEEWTEATVQRIRRLRPRRVLEIGCGTGLMLFRLAPECEQYVGTDLSRVALDGIRAGLAGPLSDRVRLQEGPAHRLDAMGAGGFDTVIVNSVIQYFPSQEYLDTVLEEAWRLLSDGGSLFVGDVPDQRLFLPFQTSLGLAKCGDETPAVELRRRIHSMAAKEKELFVDPTRFRSFRDDSNPPPRVALHPKETDGPNEMSRFRYDAVIAKDPAALDGWPPPLVPWSELGGVEGFAAALAERRKASFRVAGVPNAHSRPAVEAWRLVAGAPAGETAGQIRMRVSAREQAEGWVTPKRLVELARASGRRGEAVLTKDDGPGEFGLVVGPEENAT